jgi:hypothetical protein
MLILLLLLPIVFSKQQLVNVIGGLTNPLMIASNLLGQGTSGLPANTAC